MPESQIHQIIDGVFDIPTTKHGSTRAGILALNENAAFTLDTPTDRMTFALDLTTPKGVSILFVEQCKNNFKSFEKKAGETFILEGKDRTVTIANLSEEESGWVHYSIQQKR